MNNTPAAQNCQQNSKIFSGTFALTGLQRCDGSKPDRFTVGIRLKCGHEINAIVNSESLLDFKKFRRSVLDAHGVLLNGGRLELHPAEWIGALETAAKAVSDAAGVASR